MFDGLKRKSTLSAIALLILVVALVLVVLLTTHPWSATPRGGGDTGIDNNAPALTGIATLPPAEVPSALPSNLPLEKDVQVLQNFSATDAASGKLQATRVYVSKLSAENNFTIFQKYLTNNGWVIAVSVNQPNAKYLSASKDSARMDVTISQALHDQVTVNVSILQ